MDLGEMLYEFVMGIFLTIDGIVYTFINWIYQIILIIADQNIFGDSAIMENFVGRIYTIIGVIMLFVLAYSLLKSMINPDELTKGKQSPAKIITNVIISIAIIALAPTVFNFAMQFQSALLEQNTIGRIIIGSSTSSETSDTISRGGREMALGVLNAFIFPSDSAYCNNLVEEADSEAGISNCEIIEINSIGATYGELMDTAANTNLVTTLPELAGEMGGSNPRLTYYFLVSTAAGIFVLFVLVSYCIEIAIRMIKLAVFQFITPIPAIARVMPNEQAKKVFDNWVKACLSTYLEVFIRLALLFFAVFIISIIREQITEGNLLGALFRSSNPILGFLAQAFIIIGIVMFIKQAPGIIKDITGLDGGKYGFFSGLKGAMQTGAMFASGITTATRNFNAKDENGENRNMRTRLASAAAGFGSGFGRSFKTADDVKDIRGMRSNIHNSAEEAIKKRIQRENNRLNTQRERDSYIEELNQKRREAGQEEIGAVAGRLKYKAHKISETASEWAGRSEYNAVAVQRTKELADKIETGFSAIEGTWKKSQGFIDAKAEADKTSNQFNAMQQAYRNMIAQGITEEKAKENIAKSWKMTLEEAEIRKNNAKALQEEIERTEQKKKAESIATAARNIQLSVAQYSDIKIDENRVLERESDLSKRAAMESARNFYGNLNIEDNYRNLINDLQSSDREAQNRARSLLDYFDKYNLEAKYQKGEAQYQEEQRKSTIKPNDKGGSGK